MIHSLVLADLPVMALGTRWFEMEDYPIKDRFESLIIQNFAPVDILIRLSNGEIITVEARDTYEDHRGGQSVTGVKFVRDLYAKEIEYIETYNLNNTVHIWAHVFVS